MIINGMKKCVKCGEDKEANKKYFHGDKMRKDGLKATCKDCINIKKTVPDGYKRCTKCKQILPVNSFYNQDKSSYCKECRKENSRMTYKTKGRK
ncbi:MAG: hypothetical protein ACRCZ0_12525 [Cetobacterium sp.]